MIVKAKTTGNGIIHPFPPKLRLEGLLPFSFLIEVKFTQSFNSNSPYSGSGAKEMGWEGANERLEMLLSEEAAVSLPSPSSRCWGQSALLSAGPGTCRPETETRPEPGGPVSGDSARAPSGHTMESGFCRISSSVPLVSHPCDFTVVTLVGFDRSGILCLLAVWL